MYCLSVDDFADPEEVAITTEQIHLTVVRMGTSELPMPCFALPVTSARELVRQLETAIRRREYTSNG